MFESPEVLKIEEERKEMMNHLKEKWPGSISLLQIMTDVTLEIKHVREELTALKNLTFLLKPEKKVSNGKKAPTISRS